MLLKLERPLSIAVPITDIENGTSDFIIEGPVTGPAESAEACYRYPMFSFFCYLDLRNRNHGVKEKKP